MGKMVGGARAGAEICYTRLSRSRSKTYRLRNTAVKFKSSKGLQRVLGTDVLQ
jgi:hypothetical protein